MYNMIGGICRNRFEGGQRGDRSFFGIFPSLNEEQTTYFETGLILNSINICTFFKNFL